MDKDFMNAYFKDVHVVEGDFYGNILNAGKENERNRIQYAWLGRSIYWRWFTTVTSMTANYLLGSNLIVISAGFLQDYFFNTHSPNYLNFGAIVSVIGHEITHGFDATGSLYDEDGDLKNWWDKATKTKFRNKAKCIRDFHYDYDISNFINGTIGKYELSNGTEDYNVVNGTVKERLRKWRAQHTLNENIADIGGVKGGYVAYEKWLESNGEERMLPGMRFTNRQMFWIGWARVWCSRLTQLWTHRAFVSDEHAIGRYRILGPLQNNENFANDFNCRPGNGMIPKKRCKLW